MVSLPYFGLSYAGSLGSKEIPPVPLESPRATQSYSRRLAATRRGRNPW